MELENTCHFLLYFSKCLLFEDIDINRFSCKPLGLFLRVLLPWQLLMANCYGIICIYEVFLGSWKVQPKKYRAVHAWHDNWA